MRKKLNHYKLSKRDLQILKDNWYINWCGWKGSTNFSKIIKHNIETFWNFKSNKAEQLFDDIEYYICHSHDIDFSLWGNIFSFYKANFIFAYKLYKITRFATFWERLFIWMLAYYLLNKFGKKFFYFWKKRDLKWLLNNKQ